MMDSEFLKKVEHFNEAYCSIRINGKLEDIAMPFWPYEEIQKGLSLRKEWEVSLNLIPFQGDWHDILCLDKNTQKVIFLNDERKIVQEWKNTDEFIKNLSREEVVYDTAEEEVIITRTSPEFLAKINEYKKKR